MASNNTKNKPKPTYNRPNFWGFLSNFSYASINKGQLLPILLTLCLLVFLFRLPSNHLLDFGKEALHCFEVWHILGWCIVLLETLSGYLIIRRMRKKHGEEIDRISKEKTILQEKLLNRKMGSSNKK